MYQTYLEMIQPFVDPNTESEVDWESFILSVTTTKSLIGNLTKPQRGEKFEQLLQFKDFDLSYSKYSSKKKKILKRLEMKHLLP